MNATTNNPNNQLTKVCTRCQVEKPATLEYFGARKRAVDGFHIWCRPCEKSYQDEYRAANRERLAEKERQRVAANAEAIAAYKRQWAEANADRLKQQRRERYEANRDEILAEQAKYRAENPEKVKASKRAEYERNREKYLKRTKEYREANPEKVRDSQRRTHKLYKVKRSAQKKLYKARNVEQVREWSRNYKKRNADKVRAAARLYNEKNRDKLAERRKERQLQDVSKYRQTARVHAQRRLARKRSLPDTLTPEQWQNCLDYFNGCCAVCGDPASLFNVIQADHFIPLTSPDCIGTVKENIIPLCRTCNTSKNNRDALEWATERLGKRKGKQFVKRIEAYFASLK